MRCAKGKEIEKLRQLTESLKVTKDKEIHELRQQNKRLKEDLKNNKAQQLNNKRNDFTWQSLNTDKKMKTFTGVPNKCTFNYLYKKLKKQFQN